MNKEEIKKLDQEKIVGTYSRYDMVADHGKGAKCVSVDGKEYIDFTAGIGVNCLGFCDDGWVEAVTGTAEEAAACVQPVLFRTTGQGSRSSDKEDWIEEGVFRKLRRRSQ